MEDDRKLAPRRRRQAVAVAAVLGLGISVGALWMARAPLASAVVARYLASHGIESRYQIETLMPGRVVLTGVRLGPSSRPDLVAERVTVDLVWQGGRPAPVRVALIRPTLRVHVSEQAISLGSLDALMPPPSDEPLELPDLGVDVEGGTVVAQTPWGNLRSTIMTSGKLPEGFTGRIAIAPTDLTHGDCRVGALGGTIAIATEERRFEAAADLGAGTLRCAGLSGTDLRLALDGGAPAALDRFTGRWRIDRGGMTMAPVSTATLGGQGNVTLQLAPLRVRIDGALHGRNVRLATALRLPNLAGTPIGPLAAATGRATARALQRFDADTQVRLDWQDGGTEVALQGIRLASASGARIVADRIGLARDLSLSAGGNLAISGGGLPAISGRLDRLTRTADGDWSVAGRLSLAPWRGGGSAVAVPRLDLRYDGQELRLNGLATLSGPLGGGRVDGLRLPLELRIDQRAGLTLASAGCLRPEFDRLALPGTTIGAGQITLCANDGPLLRIDSRGRLSGGLSLQTGAISGSLGEMPVRLTLGALDLRWQGTSAAPAVTAELRSSTLMTTIGEAMPLRLDLDRFWADWQPSGTLRLTQGEARVSEAVERPRFAPVRIADIVATLANGRLTGTASALNAAEGHRLAQLDFRHDVDQGSGRADVAVDGVHFDDKLQPYELSELARGLVADVVGTVNGSGWVAWTSAGIASGGRFETKDMALATAALGPVTGITGTLDFDDLVALTTPRGQTLHIATINPGVLIEDGQLRYHLREGSVIEIEEAHWPFSGGTLTLDPATIDPANPNRRFTVHVKGLDAALFLQKLEFKNLHATGRFDGVLPVVFDKTGGRIDGGWLTARPGGGSIQYAGEVGEADMGAAARFAFDALKKLRYNALTLEMNGQLDGELVTAIRFSGINEAPVRPAGGVPVKASGLPFRFNVTVRAPFQRLLNSAASLSDARTVIRPSLPVDIDQLPGVAPVQHE